MKTLLAYLAANPDSVMVAITTLIALIKGAGWLNDKRVAHWVAIAVDAANMWDRTMRKKVGVEPSNESVLQRALDVLADAGISDSPTVREQIEAQVYRAKHAGKKAPAVKKAPDIVNPT
jgi:hypothetical protein